MFSGFVSAYGGAIAAIEPLIERLVNQFHLKGIYPSEAAISMVLDKPGCFRD